MKVLLIFVYLMQQSIIISSLTAICDYRLDDFVILNEKYKCEVKKKFKITSKNSTLITNVTGLHKSTKSNENVAVFKIYNITVNFFPTGLSNFFKNLEGIDINFCELKELNQDDLKQLSSLVYLDLSDNDIQIIKTDTFKYNLKLKLIWLKRNKIYHIDSNAFGGLTELTNLNLLGNSCVDLKGTNADDVKKVTVTLNHTCTSQEYLARKCNESVVAKLDEIEVKNESLVSNKNQTVNNFLLESIEKLITEKFNENFNKTQELFTNLAEKVNKIEQELKETKNQITSFLEINSNSTNKSLSIPDNIQQLMSNSSTKCEPITDIFKNTIIKMILESQTNISQEIHNLQNSQIDTIYTQNLTAISKDLEEVKKSLSNTQAYVAVTIQSNAENTASELKKLKQDIKGVEGKITANLQAELKTVKNDLEDVKNKSQSESHLTTISTVTEVSMFNVTDVKETTTVTDEPSIVTEDAENTTRKSIDTTETSLMYDNIIEKSSTQATATLATENEEDTSTPAVDNSTTQDVGNEESSSVHSADNENNSTVITEAFVKEVTLAADSISNLLIEVEVSTNGSIIEAEISKSDSKTEAAVSTNNSTAESAVSTKDSTTEDVVSTSNLTTEDTVSTNNSTAEAAVSVSDSTTEDAVSTKDSTTEDVVGTSNLTTEDAVSTNDNVTESVDSTNDTTTEAAVVTSDSTIDSKIEVPIVDEGTTTKSSTDKTEDAPLNSKENSILP